MNYSFYRGLVCNNCGNKVNALIQYRFQYLGSTWECTCKSVGNAWGYRNFINGIRSYIDYRMRQWYPKTRKVQAGPYIFPPEENRELFDKVDIGLDKDKIDNIINSWKMVEL